jgi:hypothetical protein
MISTSDLKGGNTMQAKQAKKYLKQRGIICPFCGSWDIEGASMDFEAGEIAQRISCHECNEKWTDVYKLVAVADSDSGTIIASISIQAE